MLPVGMRPASANSAIALDARLAQQMQHRVGRAVAVVFDCLRLGIREPVMRMETGAREAEFFDSGRTAVPGSSVVRRNA